MRLPVSSRWKYPNTALVPAAASMTITCLPWRAMARLRASLRGEGGSRCGAARLRAELAQRAERHPDQDHHDGQRGHDFDEREPTHATWSQQPRLHFVPPHATRGRWQAT